MRLSSEAAEIAFRVLAKCSAQVEPAGPWRWRCVAQNGALLPLWASLGDGFLHLAGPEEALGGSASTLERALLGNETLGGGVKFALNLASRGLHLRTDIALLEEAQLAERVPWALAGFQEGYHRFKSLDPGSAEVAGPTAGVSKLPLGELLGETSWSCTERGANAFSADLQRDSAPPARITANDRGVVFSVELVRCEQAAEFTRQALAVFLLTTTSALRMVRAYALQVEGQQVVGLQVSLPPAPAAEEIDHALAALSTAYPLCAREANVLLNKSAAQCYLSVRAVPSVQNSENEKEN